MGRENHTKSGVPRKPFWGLTNSDGSEMRKCLNVIEHGIVLVVRRDDNSAYLHTLFMWLGAMRRIS
jgi:hypothetical protein